MEGRVLAVDPSSRKMVLTLKPALLGSRLPIIAAVEHAAPGALGAPVQHCHRLLSCWELLPFGRACT